jgi:pimeloyl-ACP methyl ester carboxylesterase
MRFLNFPYQKIATRYKGYKIQTYIFGTGKEIVFAFPSFPHSGLYYIWFLSRYDLSKVKFITFDLPGWIGLSDNIFKTVPFSLGEFVEVAKLILAKHHVKKYSIVGYSFGGALAVKLASDQKEKIKNVALVSSVVNGVDVQKYRIGKLVNFLYGIRFSPLLKYYVERTYHKYKASLNKENLPRGYTTMYENMINRSSPRVLLTSIYTLFHTDWTCYFRNLKGLRILVANTLEEPLYFHKQAEHMRKVLKGCYSIAISGNHEDFVLKPKREVVKEVVNFLRGRLVK